MLGRGGLSMFSQRGAGGPPDPSAGYAPYTGPVATRGLAPHDYAAGQLTSMCRTSHFSTYPITSLRLIYVGWSYNSGGETALGVTNTWRASIEYPSGTFTQVLFSGVASGSCASGGLLTSDACTVSIPVGAKFWVRTWQSNANGILFRTQPTASPQDSMVYGASVTDLTMSGTVGGTGGGIVSGPAAIIGSTTRATTVILGDSRTDGVGGSGADATTGEAGAVRPSFNNIGYVDFSVSSTVASVHLAANTPMRRALATAAGCTHLFSYLGINDLNAGRTAAQLISDHQQIKTDWGGLLMVPCTLDPHSSSTDAWATTVNQTPQGDNINRVSYNTTLRANPTWAQSVIDAASATESSLNSGKWAPNFTGDGIHANAAGYSASIASGVFTRNKFSH